MRSDNSRHIIAAARQRSQYTRAKAIQALRNLDAAGEPVTFESVAQKAGVSRSWLYTEPDLRAEIEQLRAARRRATTSQFRRANAPPRRPCCAGSKPLTTASGSSPRRTNNSASTSPEPSVSNEPPQDDPTHDQAMANVPKR